MQKTLAYIILVRLLVCFVSANPSQKELYQQCRLVLPKKSFDMWRLRPNWHRQLTYPPIFESTVCKGQDHFLQLSLRNLEKPPYHYIPFLPVPLLLCTDYNNYAVIIFCKIEFQNGEHERNYKDAIVVTVEEQPKEVFIKKAMDCLKDISFIHLKQMQRVKSIEC